MRKEHHSHALVISLMLLVLLVAMFLLISNNNKGFNPTITTSISTLQVDTTSPQIPQDNGSAIHNEVQVLVGLLILLAFFAVVYVIVRIIKEIKGHYNHPLRR